MQEKEINFKELGFKAGLEVHQQLDTKKLFCRCPSLLMENIKPDFIFERKLRLSASELGEFDKAALEELKKDLTFEYYFFNKVNCLIEADEEPPKEIDSEALKTTLKVCLMTNALIPNELIVMRKIVLDGSNVSGFQRTMLAGINGFIELKNKKVRVQSIVLEEDAARPIAKKENKIIYNLDRLGIPLIEFATAPDLSNDLEVKECALKIGELLRRTCKCKRGLGTIRQDINISIKEGARIELKGIQELELIDLYVRREVLRQLNLIKLKKLINEKTKKEKILNAKVIDLSNALKESESNLIKNALKQNKAILGFKLENFKGLLGFELQPNRRFATELSDYVKAESKAQGIIHSDELPAYGITEKEIIKIKELLECKENDAFIFVAEKKEEAIKAINAVKKRIETAFDLVPEETRNALENGNSSYSRPLPGAARMYPETDIPVIKITKELINEIKKELPLTIQEREKLYASKGLSNKLINEMKLSNYACFFESLLKEGFNATTIAVFLLENLKELERNNFKTEILSNERIKEILLAEKQGLILKENLKELTIKAIELPEKSIKELIPLIEKKIEKKELNEIIEKIIKENSKLIKEKKEKSINTLMGLTMKELKGKASGREIAETLKEKIKNYL